MKDVVPEHSFFNEMRGETSATFDMSSAFLQAGIRPMTGYQQPGSVALQSQSPEPACQFYPIIPKQEMIDDSRNDSGINTSPSASPGSEHNENITNPLGTSPNHESTPAQSQYPWYMTSPNNMEETNSPSPSYQSSISPKMDCGDENIDDEEKKHSVPKVNSHGKIKVHKCKQCTFVAYTKLDFWKHSRVHIKGDKILSCPRCPFVTEYKHHLEYHLLNHAGAKPFKCEHCDYSCVNKSMLNSHMKSHSNVYQYRCSDCLYETKYCHSLKLHLRKYNHQPAMMLDPDGSPNPVPIIDVYGTRRGPKLKKVPKTSPKPPTPPPMEPQQTQLPYNPAINPLMPPMPYPFQMPSFPPNPQVMENLQRLVKAQMEELVRQQNAALMQGGVLDLSKSAVSNNNNNNNSDDDEEETTMFSNVEAVVDKKDDAENMGEEVEDKEEPSSPANNNKYEFECQFCSISFGDEVLFRIHMGYHGYTNPFTCNSCGEECKDKVNFCLHMARAPH